MKFLLSVTLLASTLLANVSLAERWKPKPGLTWDYILGGDEKTIEESDKDVVTFDLEYAEKMVPVLHERGQKAVCYFSGGTTENKPDRKDYEKAGIILYEKEDGWGNYLLDIKNKKKLQPLIRKRFQRAYKYGCDGVEVDVLGLYNHYPEKFTKEDSYVFAKWVAETGHEENVSVGLKNLPSLAERLESYFDFAIVESCVDYNECKYFKVFSQKNKAVFIVQYKNHPDSKWDLSGSKLKKLIEAQKDSGFTCVLSKLELQTHSENYNCNTGDRIEGRSTSSSSTPSKTTTSKKINSTKTSSTKKSTSTGSTERCGSGYGKCASGYCCSQYGWCGKSSEHCGVGCQKNYGKCFSISTNNCGTEYESVCADGLCCSKYGWCGKTKDHCKSGCQKFFGVCK